MKVVKKDWVPSRIRYHTHPECPNLPEETVDFDEIEDRHGGRKCSECKRLELEEDYTDIPRDPSFYSPSAHAQQQSRHRGIDWDMVGKAIDNGDIKPSYKDDVCIFVKECTNEDEPVGVVADYKAGVILTVEWRND